MTDYRTTGINQINQWLWANLKNLEYAPGKRAFEVYESGDLASVTPIIPVQQRSQFTNIAGGAPFVVYNYVVSPSFGTEFYRKREQGAFVIYDNEIARLRAIHLRMCDLLCREDITAAEINRWLTIDDGGNSPWDFKYVHLEGAVGPDEFAQEGGRQGATITISYEFTRDLDSAGLRI